MSQCPNSVNDNSLTGILPTEMAALSLLKWFEPHGNAELGGSIPNHFCAVEPKSFGCDGDSHNVKETLLCGCHCNVCP